MSKYFAPVTHCSSCSRSNAPIKRKADGALGKIRITRSRRRTSSLSRSMAKHITDHFNAGREHWGIFEIQTDPIDIGSVAESLYLYWAIESATAIKNSIIYL